MRRGLGGGRLEDWEEEEGERKVQKGGERKKSGLDIGGEEANEKSEWEGRRKGREVEGEGERGQEK